MDALPGILSEILIFTFGLVMPLIFAVGVLITHRIAGPVYRFEQYLGQVARGEEVGPCRIRSGDELQDLCDVINDATAALQASQGRAVHVDAAGESEEHSAEVRKAG
jgi:signal transduction histidine kinase